jgi:hypothetical protein
MYLLSHKPHIHVPVYVDILGVTMSLTKVKSKISFSSSTFAHEKNNDIVKEWKKQANQLGDGNV